MYGYNNCPSCGIEWNNKETITEYFLRDYSENGIPEYKTRHGFTTVEEAAADSAKDYGCTPLSPQHFSKNVLGIETEGYDGVSWWKCLSCGIAHNKWNPKRTTNEFQKIKYEEE